MIVNVLETYQNMVGIEVEPELKPDKGLLNGSCNRRACQKPGATWYNKWTYAHYCKDCARLINRSAFPEKLCEEVTNNNLKGDKS